MKDVYTPKKTQKYFYYSFNSLLSLSIQTLKFF